MGSKTLARNEQGTIGDWTQDMCLAEFYWDSAHPSKTKERPRNGQGTAMEQFKAWAPVKLAFLVIPLWGNRIIN